MSNDFMKRLNDYFTGKQSKTRQNQLDEIERGDPTSAPALPSNPALKETEDSMRKAFGKPTSQLEPEYRERMSGLVRGAQMRPEDLQKFQEQQRLNEQNAGPRGGVSDEQWKRAQDKMDEILTRQPKIQENELEYVDMSPEDIDDAFKNATVVDDSKLRALQRLRGSK